MKLNPITHSTHLDHLSPVLIHVSFSDHCLSHVYLSFALIFVHPDCISFNIFLTTIELKLTNFDKYPPDDMIIPCFTLRIKGIEHD